MAYFNELPNLEVISRFVNTETNEDFIKIKNLWRRAKIRDDIVNAITAFNYYQIKDRERPDQIAQKYYGDPELDWVILITNNITNLNEDWPLDNNTLYNYLIEKYGSEEELQKIHHTETLESRDEFNRLVIPEKLKVDPSLDIPKPFKTTENSNRYQLDAFPLGDGLTKIKINLIQALPVLQRQEGEVLYLIPDIRIETSRLKVYKRDNSNIDVNIDNDLFNNWASSWGGNLPVVGRDQIKNIDVIDVLSNTVTINIPERLYEITGELVDDEIVPIFTFRYRPNL